MILKDTFLDIICHVSETHRCIIILQLKPPRLHDCTLRNALSVLGFSTLHFM